MERTNTKQAEKKQVGTAGKAQNIHRTEVIFLLDNFWIFGKIAVLNAFCPKLFAAKYWRDFRNPIHCLER